MRCSLVAAGLLLAAPSLAGAQPSSQPPADAKLVEFFEAKVRPLLMERCLSCHGEKKQKGGLRLDSRAGWMKGGESGPAIVPGKARESELLKRITAAPPTCAGEERRSRAAA